MVDFTDLKVYKSTSDLGGAITATEIQNSASNNMFTNVPRSEYVAGETYYKCMYWKNTHATESMDDFKIRLSGGTPSTGTSFRWGFDPFCNPYYGVIKFDGINDYIDCTNDSDLWSQGMNEFSFSFWIFPTAGWDTNDRLVVNHGDSSNHGFRVFIDDAVSNRIFYTIKDSGGVSKTAFNDTLQLNQWNHIACVYDNSGSGNIKIYVNGVIGTNDDLIETINLSATLKLSDSSTDFQGYMRDFKFFLDDLSSQQVTDDYNGTLILAPDYHLPMNERTGNPKDSVSGTKTATLSGATWVTEAQTIADVYTEPIQVTWLPSGDDFESIGKLAATKTFPTWQRLTVNADPTPDPIVDDQAIWTINFDIPQTGTGTPGGGGTGGGTGGNPPPVSTDFKICVAGDWGCEPETDDVIDLIQDEGYDLVVGVGDNAYESASCWTNRFQPLRSIMESAYGNHEYEESGGTSPYKTFFGNSFLSGGLCYTFQFENILFLMIDSNDDKSGVSLDTQRTQIASVLESKKNDSTITWRIAIMHHPWFGASSDHPRNEFDQVQKFHKLFTDYRVSFVCTGHNHNWQRSHQVGYNSSSPTSPTTVDNSAPYSRDVAGLIHVVTGTGGHDSGGGLYDLNSSPSFNAYQNNTHNGVWEIVASNTGQTLTCSFVEVGGDKFDTFVINA